MIPTNFRLRQIAACLLTATVVATTAWSDDKNWIGINSTDPDDRKWHNPDNWSPGGAPSTADLARIHNTGGVQRPSCWIVDGNAAASDVIIFDDRILAHSRHTLTVLDLVGVGVGASGSNPPSSARYNLLADLGNATLIAHRVHIDAGLFDSRGQTAPYTAEHTQSGSNASLRIGTGNDGRGEYRMRGPYAELIINSVEVGSASGTAEGVFNYWRGTVDVDSITIFSNGTMTVGSNGTETNPDGSPFSGITGDSISYVCDADLTIDGGILEIKNSLTLAQDSTLSVSSGGEVRIRGSFDQNAPAELLITSTSGTDLAGLGDSMITCMMRDEDTGGNQYINIPTASTVPANPDNGFTPSNFVIDHLVLGGNNQSGQWDSVTSTAGNLHVTLTGNGDSVFVRNLEVRAGVRIHMNNKRFFFLKDGTAREFRPGDADLDGDVDAFDLGIWQANFGTTTGATWQNADFDGDRDVDAFDKGIWQIYFNGN